MSQTRRSSLIETLAGTAIGFAVTVAASHVVYPWFGKTFTLGQNVGIALIFTLLSIARGYVIRRLFNWLGGPDRMPLRLPINPDCKATPVVFAGTSSAEFEDGYERFDDPEPVCGRCHGDGRDPWNDYLLPCPECKGDDL